VPGPYLSDDALKRALRDRLGLAASAVLPDRWNQVVTDANATGYQDILNHLRARGYTPAQIDGWDSRAVFNRDLGLFWALTNGAGLHGFDDRYINKLDRRAELDSLLILVGGVAVDPGDTGAEGQISTGPIKRDSDKFDFESAALGRAPSATRLDQITRW